MADENLKDFTINWALLGLLFFCLLTFTISFMLANNPTGLGDTEDIFDNSVSSTETNLISLSGNSNSLLNITSETNPEISDLGSRDSVATAYGSMGSSKGFFESIKIFMSWILTGTSGQLLIGVFGGLFGFVALFFIIKNIRQGS